MKKTAICYLLFAFYGGHAVAATFPEPAPVPFSQTGVIQNVQNYSTSPNWNPNSPYNQRMPSPVYVRGTDLTASECASVVSVYVAAECGRMNDCVGSRLSDIRPAILTQLSQLSGRNYVTACAGFIDGAFDEYIATHGNTVRNAGFPTPTDTTVRGSEFEIQNPYEYKMPKWGSDEWYQDYVNRVNTLQSAQAQNNAGSEQLIVSDFPTSYADLSFAQRMENERAGYAPYAGTSAYRTIDIDNRADVLGRQVEEQRLGAQIATAELQKLKVENWAQWCQSVPVECATERANMIESVCKSWYAGAKLPDGTPITQDMCTQFNKEKSCTDDQNENKTVAHGGFATCTIGDKSGQRKCDNGAFGECVIPNSGNSGIGGGSGGAGGGGGNAGGSGGSGGAGSENAGNGGDFEIIGVNPDDLPNLN